MDMNINQLASSLGIPAAEIDHMRQEMYADNGLDYNDSLSAYLVEDRLYEELLDIKQDLEGWGER